MTRSVLVVLLGPPGAGKSTLAQALAARFDLEYVYTPTLYYYATVTAEDASFIQSLWPSWPTSDEEVAANRRANVQMPPHLLAQLAHRRLARVTKSGALFDGGQFPSTLEGAKALTSVTESQNWDVIAIFLSAALDTVHARIQSLPRVHNLKTHRGMLQIQRADDCPTRIRERFQHITRTVLPPLLTYYKQRERALQFDSSHLTPDELLEIVSRSLQSSVEEVQNKIFAAENSDFFSLIPAPRLGTSLVVSFSGFGQQLQMPTYEFYSYLRDRGESTKLFFRDINKRFFLEEGKVAQVLQIIQRAVERFAPHDVLFIGTCGGGFSAILFASFCLHRIPVHRVVAFSPVTLLQSPLIYGHGPQPGMSIRALHEASCPMEYFDLRPHVKKLLPHCTIDIHYSRLNNMDAHHAQLLANSDSRLRMFSQPTNRHSVARYLRDLSVLSSALEPLPRAPRKPVTIVYGAQRSGHHSVIMWMIANRFRDQEGRVAWFRHIPDPFYDLRDPEEWDSTRLVTSTDRRLDTDLGAYFLPGVAEYKSLQYECAVLSIEDQCPGVDALHRCSDDGGQVVLVVRDWYNNSASRISQRPYPPLFGEMPDKFTPEFAHLWQEHARMALGLHSGITSSPHMVLVRYNWWLMWPQYRRYIAERLGFELDVQRELFPLSKFGGGSSFVTPEEPTEYLHRCTGELKDRVCANTPSLTDLLNREIFGSPEHLDSSVGMESDSSSLLVCHHCGDGPRHNCSTTVTGAHVTREFYDKLLRPHYAAAPIADFLLADIRGVSELMQGMLVNDLYRRFTRAFLGGAQGDWLAYPDPKFRTTLPSEIQLGSICEVHYVAWWVHPELSVQSWWNSAGLIHPGSRWRLCRFTCNSKLLRDSLVSKPSDRYLHSLADIQASHADSMCAVVAQMRRWISEEHHIAPEQLRAFIHFPISAVYSTLHIHMGNSRTFLHSELDGVSRGRSVEFETLMHTLGLGQDPVNRFHFQPPVCAFEPLSTILAPSAHPHLQRFNPDFSLSHIVAVFDCDGTLTSEGQPATPEIMSMLHWLRGRGVGLVLVSGAEFESLDDQFHQAATTMFDLVCAQNGLDSRASHRQYMVPLSELVSEEVLAQLTAAAHEYVTNHPYPFPRCHPLVRVRSCMLNICLVDPQRTDLYEAFAAWDSQFQYMDGLIEYIQTTVPTHGMLFLRGSPINVDCVYHTKEFMLRFLRTGIDKILFFGDRCSPGGNDYALWMRCQPHAYAVQGVLDTMEKVKQCFMSSAL